jgi:hypothetical protein
MKARTVKVDSTKDEVERVRLLNVDRNRHVLCVNSMKSIVKYFFLADILKGGGVSSWINTFFP